MKKLLITTLIVSSAFAKDMELKKYWDSFYTEIKSCITDKYKSKDLYKPAKPIEDTMDLKAYLKALDYEGYVVYIDTKRLTESDICFLKYLTKQLGYNPKYYAPVEILVVEAFDRPVDATKLKIKLESLMPKPKKVSIDPRSENVKKTESIVKVLNLD